MNLSEKEWVKKNVWGQDVLTYQAHNDDTVEVYGAVMFDERNECWAALLLPFFNGENTYGGKYARKLRYCSEADAKARVERHVVSSILKGPNE